MQDIHSNRLEGEGSQEAALRAPIAKASEQDAGSDAENLEPALQRQVDENLQLLYRQKIEESLPDALQDLVARLLSEGAAK